MTAAVCNRQQAGPKVAIGVLIAVAYVVVAKLSFLVTIPPGNISPIFPAAGIALAAVLLAGRVALPAVWVGSFVSNLVSFAGGTMSELLSFRALAAACCIGTGAMLGAWIGAILVKRFCREESPLGSGAHMVRLLVFGALIGGLLSPTFGTCALTIAGFIAPERLGFSWLTWWSGDVVGCIVMAPLVLAWFERGPASRDESAHRIKRWAEAILLAVLTGAVCYFAFFARQGVESLLLVVLIWAAFRFGMREVTLLALVVACAAAIGTASGTSEFSTGAIVPTLLLLYAYLGSTVVCALILAAVLREQRQIASALRDGEQRFQLAASAADIGVWDWDIRADRLVWDDAMLRIYGARREGFAGAYQTWVQCLHPEDAARATAAVDAAVRGEREYEVEFRIVRPDGNMRFLQASARVFRDRTGKAERMVGVNIDITERKQAEENRVRNEALFRSFFDAVPIPLSYANASGSILRHNSHFEKLFGYTIEEIPSIESWFQHAYPDPAYRARVSEKWNEAHAAAVAESRPVTPTEYQITCKDGSVRTIEVSGISVGEYFLATFFDVTERRLAEEQIKDSEMRYRRLIETANEGIWLLDHEKTLFVNPKMAGMLGYSAEEFVGRSPTEFMFSEDRESFYSMRKARTAGISQSYERRFRHKNGNVVWTHVSVSPVCNDSGTVVGSFAMFADITERKKAESRDGHIRHILELVASGNPLGEILEFVCRAVEKDLPGALTSVLLFDAETGRLRHGAAPDLPEFYQAAIDGIVIGHGVGSCGSAAADGVPVIVEDIQTHPYWEGFREIAAKAGLRACWSLPILTSDGKVVATFAIYHAEPFCPEPEDIQAVQVFVESIRIAVESHRSAEEIRRHREHLEELVKERSRKLMESKGLLSTILDNVDACIYLKDRQGRYLFANRPVLELWNTKLEDIVGMGDEVFFDADTVERIRETDRQVIEEGRVIRMDETNTVPATGKTVTYQSTKLPLRREDGAIYALCGISTDITVRKEMELDLIRARDAAESANRAKSAFLSNMSHELRTPLNAILGYAQMMVRDREPDAPDVETLRIINKSGEHLLSLINSVLDLSKIESHKYALELEDFDLGGFVREIADIFRRRAEDKGLTISVDQTSSFPRYVRADRNKLRQVLINIVGNAVKFTDKGGVTLRLATGGAAHENGSAQLVFTVTDTGPGILPEDRERIFKPFEQATNRPQAEGSGLGLTLAREFVRLMGGDVRVSDAPGGGSVFTFEIIYSAVEPAAMERLGAPPAGEIVAIEGAENLKVLIVEDQLENRILLRALLSRFGFNLAEAENGEVAVRLTGEWKPDMILMDRRMPVMDGVVATRRIRELPGGGGIRIAAVTAEAFREDYEGMMAAGCDAFIRKPYKIDEILECIGAIPTVKVIRADSLGSPGTEAGDCRTLAKAAFAELPADLIAAVRSACQAADAEEVASLLTPYTQAAAAAAPFLKEFRTDVIATLLP